MSDPARGSYVRTLMRSGTSIAIAIGVMNLATYGFTIVAARILGPTEYGALAGLMATLMVLAVLQLGLQATAARRISAEPEHVAQIEQSIMRVTYRGALVLGAVLVLAAPLVQRVLRLDSLPDRGAGRGLRGAALDHGRPGRHPPGRAPLVAAGGHVRRRGGAPARARHRLHAVAAHGHQRHGRRHDRDVRADRPRLDRAARRAPPGRPCRSRRTLGHPGVRAQLAGAAGLLRALERRHRHRPQRAARPPGRPLRGRPDPHEGGAVPAAVRGDHRLPLHVLGRRAADRPDPQPGRRRGSRRPRDRAPRGCCRTWR